MYEHHWNDVLSRTGFSGSYIALRDWPDELNHMTSVSVSTAAGLNVDTKPTGKRILVADGDSIIQQSITQKLSRAIMDSVGVDAPPDLVSIVAPVDVIDRPTADSLCVFLPELERAFLSNLEATGFSCLKRLTTSLSLLWLIWAGPEASHDVASRLQCHESHAGNNTTAWRRYCGR